MSPTPAEIDRMLSVKEAAELIGMKSQTLDKWRTKAGNPKYRHLNWAGDVNTESELHNTGATISWVK